MKKFTLVLLIFACHLTGYSQKLETITQNRADFLGIKVKSDFLKEPYAKWFVPTYSNYEVDNKTIDKLKKHTQGITIKVFMGGWCHDSKREIPHLYKILEAIDFDENNLEVIAVDRAKRTPNNLQEGYTIKRTPTLIFFKNNIEIGRFVEHPVNTLEKDLFKIMSGKAYKHAYDKS
tara:strand:- start:533549 stop:534076 length:528 start_codon:yes stop_codon:yes gene_type:complete